MAQKQLEINFEPAKKVYILRGLPGSGKSTFAQELRRAFWLASECVEVFSADQYFTDAKGNYNFDASKLWEAHADCRRRFQAAFDGEHYKVLIVDNTNTTEKEYQYYCQGDFTLLTVGSVNANAVPAYAERGLHDVPLETYTKMVNRFQH